MFVPINCLSLGKLWYVKNLLAESLQVLIFRKALNLETRSSFNKRYDP